MDIILGIDLAAKCENPTGFAAIDKKTIYLGTVFSDSDLIELIEIHQPKYVAIDAPLSLPSGRCCLEKECECSSHGHFRSSDKQMRQYGGVLPLTFRGMKQLTFRGMKLRKHLEKKYPEIKIIETHPRTSQKLLGFDKNKRNVFDGLRQFFQLRKVIKNDKIDLKSAQELTQHEIDGALAAISAIYYATGKFQELGDVEEGTIIVPEVCTDFKNEINPILKKFLH